MHSGQKIRFFDEKRRQKCEISLEICKKLVKKQVFRKYDFVQYPRNHSEPTIGSGIKFLSCRHPRTAIRGKTGGFHTKYLHREQMLLLPKMAFVAQIHLFTFKMKAHILKSCFLNDFLNKTFDFIHLLFIAQVPKCLIHY